MSLRLTADGKTNYHTLLYGRTRKHSVVGGDPVSGVFSAPLHGGSSEEWVTGFVGVRDRFQGISFRSQDTERYRPRVDPKTTLTRSPAAGKSAGCPVFQVGKKADLLIISTFLGSSCRACPVLTGWVESSFFHL